MSPPPSPTKAMLRKLVSGVQPVSPEEHAKRWKRSQPSSPVQQQQHQPSTKPSNGVVGGRVASMVQGFEAVSLSASSRPYSSIPPSSTSNDKPSFRLPPISTHTGLVRSIASPRSAGSSMPSSPSANSPTVPASVFQLQQAKRSTASPETEKRFSASIASGGKENQYVSPTRTRPISLHAPIAAVDVSSGGVGASRYSAFSSRGDVWEAQAASSQVSVETMATRGTDWTNTTDETRGSSVAPSPSSSSCGHAQVDRAIVVEAGQRMNESPKVLSAPASSSSIPARHLQPRIIETAPTPRKPPSPTLTRTTRQPFEATDVRRPPVAPRDDTARHRTASASAHPLVARPQPSPPLQPIAYYSPSLFTEDLSTTLVGSRPSPTSEGSFRYSPLPLNDDVPPAPVAKDVGRRQRANTLGGGLKAPFAAEQPTIETPQEREARVEAAFARLLDTMQLPDRTVRTKMLGLALPLKEEMLRASPTSSTFGANPSSLAVPKLAPRPIHHQRGRSLNNLDDSPPAIPPKKDLFKSVMMRKSKSNSSLRATALAESPVSSRKSGGGHSRTTSATSAIFRSFGKSAGKDVAAALGSSKVVGEGEDATWWAVRIRSVASASLEVKEMARLRGRLRNEAPSWVNEFLTNGGYVGLLERLKELLGMEWREEQHDDQVLYELLRCFKALTMTACGKRALASRSPTPFLPLADLLFSEKRPGDLPCRQLLIELISAVFELCPAEAQAIAPSEWSSLAVVSLQKSTDSQGAARRYTRKMKTDVDSDEGDEVFDAQRIEATRQFARSLMLGPPNANEEARIDFIKSAHRARPFKKWVAELSDCVRDYFWIFCHSQNLFWTLNQINVDQIEAPQVPSGMTGGVEYEAMAYCAAHFRLINAIASTCPTSEDAFTFHQELFESGLERVLLTLRRASLVYYQSLHLELSRYISLARSARFNLGARILACLDARTLSRDEQYVLELAKRHQQKTKASPSGAPQLELTL